MQKFGRSVVKGGKTILKNFRPYAKTFGTLKQPYVLIRSLKRAKGILDIILKDNEKKLKKWRQI